MKKLTTLIPLSCAAFALALAPMISTAADDGAPNPPPKREGGERGGFRGGQRGPGNGAPAGANLTREERQKLNAALAKARADENVVAARKAYQDAQKKLVASTKAAALKADPSVKEILDKVNDQALLRPAPPARPARPEGAPAGGRRRGAPPPAEG